MDTKRRTLLRAGSIVILGGMAGCSSITDSMTGSSEEEESPGDPKVVVQKYINSVDRGNYQKSEDFIHGQSEIPPLTEVVSGEAPDASLRIEELSTDQQRDGSALVRATLTIAGEAISDGELVVEFRLQNEDGNWRITEINPQNEGDELQELDGSVSLEFVGEDEDEPIKVYEIINGTQDILSLATVFYFQTDDQGREVRNYNMRYRLQPGETDQLRLENNVSDVRLIADGTWTETAYQNVLPEVDVVATPSGTSSGGLLNFREDPESENSATEIDYQVPNPTDITGDDIREIRTEPQREFDGDVSNEKAGKPNLELEGGKFTFSTAHPIWTSSFNVEVSGVSDSQEFSFTSMVKPEVGISIDDITLGDRLENPEVTFIAESELPVVNPIIAINPTGPSPSSGMSWDVPLQSDELDDDERVLITDSLGQERIGSSRTVTLNYSGLIDYPVEGDDTIGIGIVSGHGDLESRYPVAYTERPLTDFA